MRPRRGAINRSLVVVAIFGATLAAFSTNLAPVHAATITVDSTAVAVATDGVCTLPEAVANANANADTTGGDCIAGNGADTITFSVSGTITPAATLLPTDAAGLVVDGSGQSVVLSGANARAIFVVTGGSSLEVRRLTFEDGFRTSGGAIEEQASTLTVVDSTFRNNTADGTTGGAIRAVGGTLTISGSTFVGNDGAQARSREPRRPRSRIPRSPVTPPRFSTDRAGASSSQGPAR